MTTSNPSQIRVLGGMLIGYGIYAAMPTSPASFSQEPLGFQTGCRRRRGPHGDSCLQPTTQKLIYGGNSFGPICDECFAELQALVDR